MRRRDNHALYPAALTKPITREEERALLVVFNSGTEHERKVAKSKLVCANIKFVIQCARSYWYSYGGELDDYVQEGIIGLMRAIEKFSLKYPVKLISYAVSWIKVSINSYVMRNFSLVKIGTTVWQRQLFFTLSKYRRELSRNGVEPTDELLAEYVGVKVDVLRSFEARLVHDFSLDTPIGDGNDSSHTFMDELVSDGGSPEAIAIANEQADLVRTNVRDALLLLDERERHIMQHRMMADSNGQTLKVIGSKFGVSRERVRQIEMRTVDKLRDGPLGKLTG